MELNTAITLITLANSPIESDGAKVVLYRRNEGGQNYLVAAKEKDLSWKQKIMWFFRFKDFRLNTVNALLDEATKDKDNLRAILKDPEGMERFSKWYFYVKQRMGGKTQDLSQQNEICEKVTKAFRELISQVGLPQREPELAPELPLPAGLVRQEALSLRPTDPSRVCGIINQGDWCYLDSFVQAANASKRFKEMLQKRVERVAGEVGKISNDLIKLERERKSLSKTLLRDEKATIQLSLQIASLEEKKTYNITSAERAELEKKLRSLELPGRATRNSVKKAGTLLQEMESKYDRLHLMLHAKKRVEALFALFKELNNPDKLGRFSPLRERSSLNRFVRAFGTTNSAFSASLESHTMQDSSEVLTQLAVGDLLAESQAVCEETLRRERKECSSDENAPCPQPENALPNIKELFLPGVDAPTKQDDILIQVKPPEIIPTKGLRLQDVFKGFKDTSSVRKNRREIANNPRNKRFFGGDGGKERKDLFIKANYGDVVVERRLSLIGEPPPSLPILIGRYDDFGRKRAFTMGIPFRLQVPCKDSSKLAVYLLRSAVIHSGATPTGGHYYTYAPDLRTVDATTGLPTKFVELNDSVVAPIDASKAMSKIATDGYVLFYDRVDNLPRVPS